MFINQTDLKYLTRKVLAGKWYDTQLNNIANRQLSIMGEQTTNLTFHKNKIHTNIEQVIAGKTVRLLSILSVKHTPIIKIAVCVQKQNEDYIFTVSGEGLKYYFNYLPNILQTVNGKTIFIKPKVDINKVRIYPSFMKDKIVDIALGLIFLEIFLLNTRITYDYTIQKTGYLNLEVPIDLTQPQDLKIINMFKNYLSEPLVEKIDTGLFLFNKNTTSYEKQNIVINKISKEYPIYEKSINYNENDMNFFVDFLLSDKQYAIFNLNKHSRCLIKKDNILYVVDPWKKYIEKNEFTVLENLCKEKNYTLVFVCRNRKDQVNGEGSCFPVTLARILNTIIKSSTEEFDPTFENPILDKAAYIAALYIKSF